MLSVWNKTKYQRVDGLVSFLLLGSIAGSMAAWYYDAVPNEVLLITIIPIGLAHWSKRKLEKLLKVFGGAHVVVDDKGLTLSKPNLDYEIIIKFHEITEVKTSHWLFLDKAILTLKRNREVELVNLCDQKLILDKISANRKKPKKSK